MLTPFDNINVGLCLFTACVIPGEKNWSSSVPLDDYVVRGNPEKYFVFRINIS